MQAGQSGTSISFVKIDSYTLILFTTGGKTYATCGDSFGNDDANVLCNYWGLGTSGTAQIIPGGIVSSNGKGPVTGYDLTCDIFYLSSNGYPCQNFGALSFSCSQGAAGITCTGLSNPPPASSTSTTSKASPPPPSSTLSLSSSNTNGSPDNSMSTASKTTKSSSTGAVVGGILGAVGAVIVIVAVIIVWRRRQ